MEDTLEKELDIKVVKRNGRKVDFNGAKIAMAIKKGFDSVSPENAREEDIKYHTDDVNLIYQNVIEDIRKSQKENV